MDDERLSALARRQGGVVTTRQLVECGLSRAGIAHRVATSRLFPVVRSAYALSPHGDERTALWAGTLAVDPSNAAVARWSAAAVHGMVARAPSVVHVVVPGSATRVRRDVRVHVTRSLPASDVVSVDGLRVTAPPRTILDVAPGASDGVVRRLIREGEFRGLLPLGALADAVRAHPHHPGVARVLRVDPTTAEDALGQTVLEDTLERLIATLPLPAPGRQVELRGVSGGAYRVDFGWPDMRLAAEADGRTAHERASSLESDRFRDNDLAAVGWVVVRFTHPQLTTGRADAARQLVATAARRGWLRAA